MPPRIFRSPHRVRAFLLHVPEVKPAREISRAGIWSWLSCWDSNLESPDPESRVEPLKGDFYCGGMIVMKIPAMVPVMQVTRTPVIMALTPRVARSFFRLGAMAPIPPS